MQTIEIKALDTLFFRDGKPFSMGEETWADGIFPPSPSVIYGALRTAWALENKISVDKIAEATEQLEIHKIAYEINNNIFYSVPLDLLIEKNPTKKEKKQRENDKKYTATRIDNFTSNIPSSNKFSSLITYSGDKQLENLQRGIIDRDNLISYSQNINNNFTVKSLSDIVENENKVGIGKDLQENTTSDGMLYRVGLSRIENFKIIVQFSGLELINDIIKLGGEAKTARIKIYTDNISLNKLDFPSFSEETNKFKLVLTSPAYFKNGYLPSWIDDNMKAHYNDYDFELKNAIIGKYILQGGFDMKKGKPKTMVKLVPAGSVFYFETDKKNNPMSIFNKYSISENSEDINFNKQGFGQFIIAKI